MIKLYNPMFGIKNSHSWKGEQQKPGAWGSFRPLGLMNILEPAQDAQARRPSVQRNVDWIASYFTPAPRSKQRSCGGQCVVVAQNSCYKSVKKLHLWNDHLIYTQLQLVKGCNCRPSMHVPFEMMMILNWVDLKTILKTWTIPSSP